MVAGENEVARCGALALWSCTKSSKNRSALVRAGGVPLLAQLLKSQNTPLLVPVVSIIEVCAEDPAFRELVRTANMIPDIVRSIDSSDPSLQVMNPSTRCLSQPLPFPTCSREKPLNINSQ